MTKFKTIKNIKITKGMKNFIKLACLTQSELLEYLGKFMVNNYGKDNVEITADYIYAKGKGTKVCMLSHLDTVHKVQVRAKDVMVSNTGIISSIYGIGGDDRCGVFTICELIKAGYRPSVIFTTFEEIGGVGAGEIAKCVDIMDEIYQDCAYLLEIDRRGNNDAVFYDDDNTKFHDYICKNFGFEEAYGSYTDICTISPACGLSSVNLSSHYYNAHQTSEYVDYYGLYSLVHRVAKMLDESVKLTKPFEFIEAVYAPTTYNKYGGKYSSYSTGYGWYDDDYDDDYYSEGSNYWDKGTTAKELNDKSKKEFVNTSNISKRTFCPWCNEPIAEGSEMVDVDGECICPDCYKWYVGWCKDNGYDDVAEYQEEKHNIKEDK